MEIDLVNDGQAELSWRIRLRVSYGGAGLVAGHAVAGLQWKGPALGVVVVDSPEAPPSSILPAGERQTVAWLRLGDDKEVRVEVETVQP